MKSLFCAIAAAATIAAVPAFAADDNGMQPESSKQTNPSVSSKNTNSDGSSLRSGNNGTSTGASGSSSTSAPSASDNAKPDANPSADGKTK